MPDFDPKKLSADLSKLKTRLDKIDSTFADKQMIDTVAEFANKANTFSILDGKQSVKYKQAASTTMEFIRMLPDSLFASPDSPIVNQKYLAANTVVSELNKSVLALYLGTKAMLLEEKKNLKDINYLIQSSFGEDSASKSIRDYLLKPFGKDIKIPDSMLDIIDKLKGMVIEANTIDMLKQRMQCALQKPSQQKLWEGQIVSVLMPDGPCSGNQMTIVINKYKPEGNLQLVLPMITGYYFNVNVEEEILNKNIDITSNTDGTTSLTLIIPENISSGEVYFQINDVGGNSDCLNFWSVFEASIVKPSGFSITAGKPVIHSFTVSQNGPVYPRQYIDFNWDVENADTVRIERLPVADSPNPHELPEIQLLTGAKGTIRVPIVCTKRWKGIYALYASNGTGCDSAEPVTILLESGWSEYLIGTGKADITDPFPGLGMMGFADELQKTTDVDMHLFSRAFIISRNASQLNSANIIAIAVADIWSCTQAVKTEVINRLNVNSSVAGLFNSENVLITGTHTHSGPGGFSNYFLYNLTCGGFDQVNFNKIVDGIVQSIINAHNNLAPGRIYKNSGTIEDCGYNRSMGAYNANIDVANFPDATDKEMLLLKFVKDNDGKGNPYPVGVLNWYAIHPTSLGQSNTRISGDNKGWASHLFEESIVSGAANNAPFIAAFANSSAGDVSGSIDKDGNIIPHDNITDVENMKKLGEKQYVEARKLFDIAFEELTGSIAFKYAHLDMSNIVIGNNPSKRTWPAALGLSFGAGSSEDSAANTFIAFIGTNLSSTINEGKSTANLDVFDAPTIGVAFGGFCFRLSLNPLSSPQPAWNLPITDLDIKSQMSIGHSPKPIMFPIGTCTPFPLVPNVVPIQLLKIGQLGIAGVPAEVNTMSGRRLKESLLHTFGSIVDSIAIAAYSNAYSGYIATEEEYNQQHYEGASTLYGPHTLAAYIQEFSKLATAIVAGDDVISGSPPQIKYVALKRRGISPDQLYVINRTRIDVMVRLYRFDDNKRDISFNWPHETVPANQNLLFNLTGIGAPLGSVFQIQINNQSPVIYHIGDPPVIIQ